MGKGSNTHHVEEDIEGVRLPRVRRDKADKSDEVDSGGLDHDRSFFRKAERPARVTDRVLAHPDTVGDQHCMKQKSKSTHEWDAKGGSKGGRTRAESVNGDSRAEERFGDLLLLRNED